MCGRLIVFLANKVFWSEVYKKCQEVLFPSFYHSTFVALIQKWKQGQDRPLHYIQPSKNYALLYNIQDMTLGQQLKEFIRYSKKVAPILTFDFPYQKVV